MDNLAFIALGGILFYLVPIAVRRTYFLLWKVPTPLELNARIDALEAGLLKDFENTARENRNLAERIRILQNENALLREELKKRDETWQG